MAVVREDFLIPLEAGQAVSKGWTDATDRKPKGVTWHWTATRDLVQCRQLLGGRSAERRGEASAHYGIGRDTTEGIDRYVALSDRSWHAGINQTLRWDGKPVRDGRYKGSRTTIGVETVHIGFARDGVPAGDDWIEAAEPTGRFVMRVPPWPLPQIELIVDIGKEIVAKWPNIGVREHHGHHDLCPGYKQDVAGFPFATVLRRIYDRPTIPDVWTPLWMPTQRQSALVRLGYLKVSDVDGYWGRISDAALRRFQRDHGMIADGMWTTFVNWKVYEVMSPQDQSEFFPV